MGWFMFVPCATEAGLYLDRVFFCGVDKFAIKIDFIASNHGEIKRKFDTLSICFLHLVKSMWTDQISWNFSFTSPFSGCSLTQSFGIFFQFDHKKFNPSSSKGGIRAFQSFYHNRWNVWCNCFNRISIFQIPMPSWNGELPTTINVHLLIINAITYFVAPIVTNSHLFMLPDIYFNKFISIYKLHTPTSNDNKTQIFHTD